MSETQTDKQVQPGAEEAFGLPTEEFEQLLGGASQIFNFKEEGPEKTDFDRENEAAIKGSIKTLVAQALQHTALISDDAINTIESLIAAIDEKLTEQVNAIIHHAEFQKMESAWRGLHYLVFNTETDEHLKIKVFNCSKKALGKTLKRFPGVAWDQSPIFKKIYGEEYDVLGGYPYGCLVGDYHFDHSPGDVQILGDMAKIGAASHAPFIAGAAPSVMGMDSWQDLSGPRDLTKIFDTPAYAPWKSLRESEDSRYIGLTMPRFLSRLPYGAQTNPVEEFDFEEETDGTEHNKYCWSNSAYAMAVNINRSFKMWGWCSRIRGVESGGEVQNLPVHTFPTDDGGVDMKTPTEIAIGDRREKELSKNGFLPLIHRKNTDVAAFIGAQSLQKPAEYYDPDATANANLAARLPYLFAVSRFAHYLKCIARDKIGSFAERDDMQRFLNDWIQNYVTSANASEEIKCSKPLCDAQVEVEEVEGNPGAYSARFYLRPHYQLEELKASLRLVSKLPAVKGGG